MTIKAQTTDEFQDIPRFLANTDYQYFFCRICQKKYGGDLRHDPIPTYTHCTARENRDSHINYIKQLADGTYSECVCEQGYVTVEAHYGSLGDEPNYDEVVWDRVCNNRNCNFNPKDALQAPLGGTNGRI